VISDRIINASFHTDLLLLVLGFHGLQLPLFCLKTFYTSVEQLLLVSHTYEVVGHLAFKIRLLPLFLSNLAFQITSLLPHQLDLHSKTCIIFM
jgi:hypothetical protein